MSAALFAPLRTAADVSPSALLFFKPRVYIRRENPSKQITNNTPPYRVRGRAHYYSSKKEEYAIIKFSLDADLSSLFTWNTKQLFVYVTAEWPDAADANSTNSAVIWDSIITSPSSDHLANIGPATLKKLRKSAQGKSIDPSR